MTILQLLHKCEEVECTDGFWYPVTDRGEISACFCSNPNRYIWVEPDNYKREPEAIAYNKETQEKYNLVSVYFGVNNADCVTFAVPYMKPAIYPDKITNAN